MRRRPVASLAFALSVALGLCHALCYSIQLPDEVASHFDRRGIPDSWTDRATLIDLQLTVVVALAAAVLGAAGFILKTPAHWLGLPNRAWWLAPERAEHTRQDLTARLLWLGAGTQLLVLDLFHRVVRVNLGRVAALEDLRPDLAAYAVFLAGWVGVLLLRYARPPLTAR